MSRQNQKKSYNRQNKQSSQIYEYVTKEEYEQEQTQQKQEVQQQQNQYNNQQKREQDYNNRKDQKYRQQYNKNQQQNNQNKRNYNEYDKEQNQRSKNNNQQRFKQQNDYDYKRDDNEQNEDDIQLVDFRKCQPKELTNVLIKLLKYRKIECPVCYDKIHQSQKIWSCSQCYQPFHLHCIHKWIKNLNPIQQNELFNWSCPKCNMLFQEKLPEYKCFCGKQLEPEADSYSIPHSCSQKCGKKRGQYCPHPCPMDCHPGPCPECNVQGIEINCFCGKKNKQMKCSEIKKDFSCGLICGKLLNCQKHQCQKICHNGICLPCDNTHETQCYCGNEKKIINCAYESYSCDKICNKLLDCGNHYCTQKCHPQCSPCQLKPELIKTCPCGKYKIEQLQKQPRLNCLDPIPNCGMPIEKILNCGHKVQTICGSEFPECTQKVKQKCRCGDTTRIKLCNDKSEFICEDVCRKRKSCGIHFCQRECCPPNDQEAHLCLKICNKPLNCGKHNCELFCHIGACQPCPITIIQPITCPCGKSIKYPPQKCGTQPPACMELCDKILQCGHLCKSLCHQGQCPSCLESVDKLCRCKQNTIQITCSKIAICRNICGKLLKCGHKCQQICQAEEECPGNTDEGCGLKCNKIKPCGHHCQDICHPNQECPKIPCKIQIRVICQCGNRDTFVECGAIDQPVEKSLKCDQKCINIKRFGAFYKSNSLVDVEKIYYPDILLRYAHYNLQSLKKLEEKIEFFLVNSKPEENYDFSFKRDDWSELKKIALQILFSRHYRFEVQILKTLNKQYSFTLYKTDSTIIPKIKLSDYFNKVQKGIIKRDHQPFKAKIKTSNEVTSNDSLHIENAIMDFKNDFYIEKQGQQYVINFWDETAADFAFKKLKKGVGLLNFNWTLELNQQSLDEDKRLSEPAQENEIVTKIKKVKQLEYQNPVKNTTYKKQQIEQFAQLYEQYKDKAQLTEKCDQEEIQERINNQQLSIFEQDGFYQFEIKPINDNIIRCYHSEQKPFTPEYVRSPDTLWKTIDFLLENFIEADCIDSEFKKPMIGENIRDITYEDLYLFIHDRLLQVREELKYLKFFEENIYVKMIRFYVISHSQLEDNTQNLKNLISILKEFTNQEVQQYCLILYGFSDQFEICKQLQSNYNEISQLEGLSTEIQELLNVIKNYLNKQFISIILYYLNTKNILIKSLINGFLSIIQQSFASQLQILENNQQNSISEQQLLESLQIESKDQLIQILTFFQINQEQILCQNEKKEEIQEKIQESSEELIQNNNENIEKQEQNIEQSQQNQQNIYNLSQLIKYIQKFKVPYLDMDRLQLLD